MRKAVCVGKPIKRRRRLCIAFKRHSSSFLMKEKAKKSREIECDSRSLRGFSRASPLPRTKHPVCLSLPRHTNQIYDKFWLKLASEDKKHWNVAEISTRLHEIFMLTPGRGGVTSWTYPALCFLQYKWKLFSFVSRLGFTLLQFKLQLRDFLPFSIPSAQMHAYEFIKVKKSFRKFNWKL